MRVAPQSMGPAASFPVIGNPHSTDKSQDSVDDENFSMRPKINAREMDETKNLHCHTGALHQLDSAAVYSVTSKGILKKMHFHTATRAFRKRLRESVRDFAFAKQEIFKRNCALRQTDCLQHCGENVFAVFQRRNLVTFQERGSQQVPHGSDKCVVANRVIGSDGMPDFLLRRKEIPDHEQSSQTAGGSGADQLRPLR